MPIRILVVEDEWITAEGLRRHLTRLGYEIPAMVAFGEEAVVKAGEIRPDLALMDINLAGEMDGIEAAEQIRAQFDLPVIYLTAHADEAILQRAKLTGPFGYVLKPFELRDLHSAIEVALYRHGLEKQLRDSLREAEIAYDQAIIYAHELTREIGEHKQAEAELRRRNEALLALNTIATTINRSRDLDYVLQATLEQVLQVMRLEGGWIQLLDETKGALTLAAQYGLSPAMVRKVQTLPLSEGTAGSVTLSEGEATARISAGLPADEVMRALATAPIKSQEKIIGQLGLFSCRPRRWEAQEIQLLTAIAHQLGVAIESLRLGRIAAEVQLMQELDRLRSELIANVSHELRTPLGLIKIFCATLLREEIQLDPNTRQEFLQNIDAETDRLEKIVDNLLHLSRLQEKRLRLDKRPGDLSRLAAEVIKTMENQAAGHRFIHDFPAGPLPALMDAKCIEQVLRNLLHNAIKYSPAGGTIIVRGYPDTQYLCLRVSDQGIGIPAPDLERIFERFYRVENEHTRQVSGAGLGLTVCRGIIEAHGGRIWAESAPGRGSAFYFTLPLIEKEQESGLR